MIEEITSEEDDEVSSRCLMPVSVLGYMHVLRGYITSKSMHGMNQTEAIIL